MAKRSYTSRAARRRESVRKDKATYENQGGKQKGRDLTRRNINELEMGDKIGYKAAHS